MGYDVSYHPISPAQMKLWYFDRLNDPDFSQGEAIGKKAGMKDFYIEKYKETLRAAQETDPQACFDLSHSYYLAVVQGFFPPFTTPEEPPFPFCWKAIPNFPATSSHGRSCGSLPDSFPSRDESRKTIPVGSFSPMKSSNNSGRIMDRTPL